MNEEDKRQESKRHFWIDHARGFIMILLVVTEFIPQFIRDGPLQFLLAHPDNQTTTTVMNVFDIGAPAFIFIMGILMPISFFSRKEKKGTKSAVNHMIIRYGIILVLGLIVVFIDQGSFLKSVDGMTIINWDVLPTLGLIGFITLPFLWLNPKIRAIVASGMLIFYQLMLMFAGWREYAIASVHGGILGTIFSFSAFMILSTCIGEYLLIGDNDEKKKYQNYSMIGIICLIVGLLLSFLPEWYANKRQVTLSYIMISFGATILISLIFVYIDKKVQKPIIILDSYGKNPFLIYVIAIVLEFLISDIIGYEIDLIIGPIMIVVISLIALLLDRKKKIITL